ncbi:hypothetical protein C8J57DRAFT_1192477 [Mycena rebaudengoi]|nr:hypothetical protein C8J57DRAFT_1192477 [Mycena rebaudengoi]
MSKRRRCRRCIGSPYLSECLHSAAEKRASNSLGAMPAAGISSVPPTSTLEPAEGSSQILAPMGPLPNFYQNLLRVPPYVLPFPNGPQFLLPITPHGVPSTPVIDLNLDKGASPASSIGTHGEDVFSSDVVSNTTGSAGNTPTSIRQRPSKTNPIYGMVQGAYHGSEELEIVRHAMLPALIKDRKTCSKQFVRKMTDIIDRCEALSNETSCWLFVTTQHINATGPFMHYSSPRILRDGKIDMEITNKFNKLFHALIAARNEEARMMSKKLQLAEESHVSTSRELEEVRKEAEGQQRKMQEQQEIIENYKRMLATQ